MFLRIMQHKTHCNQDEACQRSDRPSHRVDCERLARVSEPQGRGSNTLAGVQDSDSRAKRRLLHFTQRYAPFVRITLLDLQCLNV